MGISDFAQRTGVQEDGRWAFGANYLNFVKARATHISAMNRFFGLALPARCRHEDVLAGDHAPRHRQERGPWRPARPPLVLP
ncbi:hypothetical protein ACFY1U_50045 [Streptomyces sp. NPDC001351]|uniref:hypothetical protein n=1 Tax=Streptomyces sp. NPDC001351 TaxID=3364564 RepID=UPI00369E08D0